MLSFVFIITDLDMIYNLTWLLIVVHFWYQKINLLVFSLSQYIIQESNDNAFIIANFVLNV